ncbi:site-specific DNA-methyltransferase [Bacillus subtilis]|uniref:site-specific DNA-methyltransferase n=1 Tax=Bacillus subtilis TaxID=1423 RepID=UPI0021552767|nr:site-specific DNA-methyltransferase [Bacillus subtilis]UVB75542.1 site-specific DNA-methyltransferase [Bacillus subtilis]
MQKLEGKTFNVVQDNIEMLKELFPEVITENKVDIDKLRLALGENVETEKEKYDFTWNGKAKATQLAQKQTTGTLRPKKGVSVNWDITQNLFLEGDNLEVLRVLQNSYRNKIKVIYIDPPYNTGKDFVYKDDFHDNMKNYKEKVNESMKSNADTNGRYHTDWLNMIYPRLKIARSLLKDDGVIFVSIDDNELANLRKVMNEIFGEENLIAELVWDLGTGTQAGHFTRSHEYVLVFAKKKADLPNFSGGEGFIEHGALKKISTKNPSSEFTFPKGTRFDAVDGTELKGDWGTSEKTYLKSGRMKAQNGELVEDVVLEAGWAMKNQMKQWFNGEPTFDSKGQKVTEFYFNSSGVLWYKKERSIINPSTVLKDKGSTKSGSNTLKDLLGYSDVFDFPKPVSLIKFLLSLVLNEDDIVLDFFAGSSTTAHAVMELNVEDGGNRRFIMVQLDEKIDEKSDVYKAGYKDICQISEERIKRAGEYLLEKYKGKEGIEQIDFGFKVFELDETNLKTWDEDSLDIEKDLLDLVEPLKEGRSQEDVVYEVLLKYGVDLNVPIEEIKIAEHTVYSVGMGYLLICLERDLTLEHIEEIAKQNPVRIVFYDEGFKDDTVRTNAQQILKRYGVEDIRVI